MKIDGRIMRQFGPLIREYRQLYGSLGIQASQRPAAPLSSELNRMRPCLLKAQRAIDENPGLLAGGAFVESPMAVLFNYTIPAILPKLVVGERVDEALQYLCEYGKDVIDQRGAEGARGNLEAIFKDLPDYLDLQSDRQMRGQRIDQTMIIDSPFRKSIETIKNFVEAVHGANFTGQSFPLLQLVFGKDLSGETFDGQNDGQNDLHLRFLPLGQINDQGLLFLTRPVFAAVRPKIIGLGLERTGVTDAFLQRIGELENLASLKLLGTDVTDQGVRGLAGLKRLKFLGLSQTKITADSLDIIGQLEQLEILGMDGISLSGRDFALRPLSPLVKLRELYLNNTQVRTGGLSYLKNLPSLRVLSLNGNRFQPGLISLRLIELTGLARLNIWDTDIERSDLQVLRQSLPNCEINT